MYSVTYGEAFKYMLKEYLSSPKLGMLGTIHELNMERSHYNIQQRIWELLNEFKQKNLKLLKN